jgi:hypothetical protein
MTGIATVKCLEVEKKKNLCKLLTDVDTIAGATGITLESLS